MVLALRMLLDRLATSRTHILDTPSRTRVGTRYRLCALRQVDFVVLDLVAVLLIVVIVATAVSNCWVLADQSLCDLVRRHLLACRVLRERTTAKERLDIDDVLEETPLVLHVGLEVKSLFLVKSHFLVVLEGQLHFLVCAHFHIHIGSDLSLRFSLRFTG